MKRILSILSASVLMLISLTSCHEEYTTYSDAEYVMFADTLSSNVITADNELFSVSVASTVACDYDRTFGVEIVDQGSNAIEGKHFTLLSNKVVIPAGERAVDVQLRGHYANITDADSLGVVLRLVVPEKVQWNLYEGWTTHKATFYKACPWDINNFTGWCVLSSMLIYNYPGTNTAFQKLVKVDKVDDTHVILRDAFYEGYDVIIGFDATDPAEPKVTMDADQVLSDEGSVFGMFHGDDRILGKASPYNTSYFNSCRKFAVLWTYVYVENVGEAVGAVGDFYNVMEWVTEEEANRIMREGL
ncbi:MAG: DUF4984 domain-containing protein [Rikenellaceae bacterium]|nr:DUF4984 domain-containing protein [Rikenellaceae bacterium]